MDRVTVYYGQIPRETDLLISQQSTMVALAKLAEAILGTSTMVDGFTLTPTTPASLNVILTGGSIFQVENLEASVWSSLPTDTAHSILKQGILLDPATIGITPPITFGFSQVYLIEVQYADLDTGATVLPYYNAALPSVSYSGPGNAGSAQSTIRKGIVATQIKAGIAATTGTQVAPTPDAGWIGLFTVTVANGQTTVTSGNIAQLASAPFIPVKLPLVPAGAQSGKWLYGVDTGAVNSVAAVLSPAPVSLTPGMTVRIKVAITNTGAMTFNPNGLGASAIVKSNGAAMSGGDVTAGMTLELSWTGSNWQAVNYIGVQSSTSTVNNNYTLAIPYCVDSSGSSNAVTAPFSPAITSLAAGDMFKVKLAHNVTGPATIAINSLSSVALVRPDGAALKNGDGAIGQILILEFDGTNMQVVGLAPNAQNGFFFNSFSGGAPSMPNNVWALINDFAASVSNLGDATLTTGVFTAGPKTAGVWAFTANVGIASAQSNFVQKTRIKLNSSTDIGYGESGNSGNGTTPFVGAFAVVRLNGGDTVSVYANQDYGGGAQNPSTLSSFSACRIGI